MNPVKTLTNIYNNLTIWAKLLFLVSLILIGFSIFSVKKEGFKNNKSFVFAEGPIVYDGFYSSIYDTLVYNQLKNEYEIGQIIDNTTPTHESVILDIGCGTGHHVGTLQEKGLNVIGIDNSNDMIQQAKKNYPNGNFKKGDMINDNLFNNQTFTHILCMYFTIYYIEDKSRFFRNAMNWLMPGGYLVVHLVDRDMFDPILPPANPLVILSPQRYAKERITKSKINFDNFSYTANFDLENKSDLAKFKEKFEFKDGKVKKQEHKMYMPSHNEIIAMAQDIGFILHGIIDLISTGYEYNNLYIFVKPN
jgi:SAM-dependent methyltransferase